jgi:predicted DNA-binding protein (MmcQ/YjbR family)
MGGRRAAKRSILGAPMPTPLDTVRSEAEKYPEAEKAFLFGDHEVYRVRKKVFVWLGDGEGPGSTYVSVKLKDTQAMALGLPYVTPAAYGMAKWGWISADFPKGKFPASLVKEWIAESYRHTAPKKLLGRLEDRPAPAARRKKKAR